jgi:hypothetical protein
MNAKFPRHCLPSWRLFTLAVPCFLFLSTRGAEPSYHFLKDIPIGSEGGWDYASVDSGARRLYVTHGTKVVVIDIDKDEVVGEVWSPRASMASLAPELGRGFASPARSQGEHRRSQNAEDVVKGGTSQNPAPFYMSLSEEVCTFLDEQVCTVFDANTGKIVTTIELSGKPVPSPTQASRICQYRTKNEVAVIDTKNTRW